MSRYDVDTLRLKKSKVANLTDTVIKRHRFDTRIKFNCFLSTTSSAGFMRKTQSGSMMTFSWEICPTAPLSKWFRPSTVRRY